jgi:hypothetical protein
LGPNLPSTVSGSLAGNRLLYSDWWFLTAVSVLGPSLFVYGTRITGPTEFCRKRFEGLLIIFGFKRVVAAVRLHHFIPKTRVLFE